jgi:ParB family transcriptional regulator, chromosome partitioning protein
MGALMARKDLLKSLMEPPLDRAPETKSFAMPPPSKGAIGAVGRSIADLKSRSVIDVPPDLIDAAGLHDRLDDDAAGIEALARSITTYGQQVPVLLRHSPNQEGRFEVVYGRRRVAAMKLAGLPVKAMLRDLTDRDLVVAQGQENAARKDLSFIEKANFARQMRGMGYDRAVICDALAVDKTVVSRLLGIADMVPLALIQAIGAAPSVGRDRWSVLARQVYKLDAGILVPLAIGDDSDRRFDAVFRATTPARPAQVKAAPPALPGAKGAPLAQVARRTDRTILTFSRQDADGFDD